MANVVLDLRRLKADWMREEERYSRLLAAKSVGNIKSPSMSGMPSGGIAASPTERLFEDIDHAREGVIAAKQAYIDLKQELYHRVREEFPENEDFRVVWAIIESDHPPRKIASKLNVKANRVYRLKNKLKNALVEEKTVCYDTVGESHEDTHLLIREHSS